MELSLLLPLLRAHGVTAYADGEVRLTLAPLAPTAASQPVEAEPICLCGHPLHDHTQAGCVHACPQDQCGLPEAA